MNTTSLPQRNAHPFMYKYILLINYSNILRLYFYISSIKIRIFMVNVQRNTICLYHHFIFVVSFVAIASLFDIYLHFLFTALSPVFVLIVFSFQKTVFRASD